MWRFYQASVVPRAIFLAFPSYWWSYHIKFSTHIHRRALAASETRQSPHVVSSEQVEGTLSPTLLRDPSNPPPIHTASGSCSRWTTYLTLSQPSEVRLKIVQHYTVRTYKGAFEIVRVAVTSLSYWDEAKRRRGEYFLVYSPHPICRRLWPGTDPPVYWFTDIFWSCTYLIRP